MGTRYTPPLEDMRFVLFDLLDAEAVWRTLPGCGNATREIVDAVLEEAGKFAANVLAPLNARGDAEGCRYDPRTHAVYTVTADFGAAPAPTAEHPHPSPAMVPGSFTIIELRPG